MTGVGSRHRPRRDRKPAAASDLKPRMSLELRSHLPYPNSCLGTSPHQQGRDTKMLSSCGIDVSKDRLDVMVLPDEQCFSVPNDKAGWAALIAQLGSCAITAIGIEASGGYERGVTRSLHAAGMPVRQVNPFKLRQFARASGVLAKNDPLDARMIASFIAIMPTRPAQPHAPAVERLAEILTMRRQLSDAKVAAENASRLLEDAMLQRLSRRRMMQRARNCGAAAPTVGAWIVDFETPARHRIRRPRRFSRPTLPLPPPYGRRASGPPWSNGRSLGRRPRPRAGRRWPVSPR